GPSRFARRLLSEWRRRGWPVRGEGAVVGVSGGADSTALLLALEELTAAGLLELTLTAAHLDHGLRGERGAEDARWVEALARALGEGVEAAHAEGLEAVRAEGEEELPEGSGEVSHAGGAGVVLRRPLLAWARRADTEAFCRARGVEFRADEMNEDERFARVR